MELRKEKSSRGDHRGDLWGGPCQADPGGDSCGDPSGTPHSEEREMHHSRNGPRQGQKGQRCGGPPRRRTPTITAARGRAYGAAEGKWLQG